MQLMKLVSALYKHLLLRTKIEREDTNLVLI